MERENALVQPDKLSDVNARLFQKYNASAVSSNYFFIFLPYGLCFPHILAW